MYELKCYKVDAAAQLPERGTKYSAGLDLHACIAEPVLIPAGMTVKIPTGLAMEIPEGYFGAVYPRSGLATKRGLRLSNCTAVIDADYRGEVLVPMYNDSAEPQVIQPNERIAQMVIQAFLPCEPVWVDNLNETERGTGGFGSTGTN